MNDKKISIIGTGYVGLTLAVVLADNGFEVNCIEINEKVVNSLNNCEPHFHENGLKNLLKKHVGKNLFFSTNYPNEPSDIYIICVATPVDTAKKPVMDYVINATEAVALHMKDNSLVMLRSTILIGVSRKIVKPILDKSNKKYLLSFCPERTVEGKAIQELTELPQIIGGIDKESVRASTDFFKKITPTTIEVSSIEAAEIIKLLNNSYRDLIFAYANEVAIICEKMSINAFEVIKAANLGYSRSSIPTPGFVGGACLEKDPHIFYDIAKQNGFEPKLLKRGREINEYLPIHVANRIDKKLISIKKDKTEKIIVLGFGFKGKPETDDIRGSLTINLINELKRLGYLNIHGFDPIVKKEVIESVGVIYAETIEQGFEAASCVIFANNHEFFSKMEIETYIALLTKPAVFFDCWQIFPPFTIQRKNLIYGGIGFE